VSDPGTGWCVRPSKPASRWNRSPALGRAGGAGGFRATHRCLPLRGFLPAKTGQRARALEALKEEQATLIFYEARIACWRRWRRSRRRSGPRPVVGARADQSARGVSAGTATEVGALLAARGSIKGEFTLLVGKAVAPAPDDTPVGEAVEELVRAGTARMDAIKQIARRRGLSKREVYEQALGDR